MALRGKYSKDKFSQVVRVDLTIVPELWRLRHDGGGVRPAWETQNPASQTNVFLVGSAGDRAQSPVPGRQASVGTGQPWIPGSSAP